MPLEVLLAVICSCAQFATAYLGWRVTVRPPATPGRRRAVEVGFVTAGLVGVLATVGLAYQSWRGAREAQAQVIALQRASMEECHLAISGKDLRPPRRPEPPPGTPHTQPAF